MAKFICENCGKSFTSTAAVRKYCGRKCYGEHRLRKCFEASEKPLNGKALPPLYVKECAVCKEKFMVPNTSIGRSKPCCSPECLKKHFEAALAKGRAMRDVSKLGVKKGTPWPAARRAAYERSKANRKPKSKPKPKPKRKPKRTSSKKVTCVICGNKFKRKSTKDSKTCSIPCRNKLISKEKQKRSAARRKELEKRDWFGRITEEVKAYNAAVFKEYKVRKKAGEAIRLSFLDDGRYYISASGNPTNI